MKKSGITICLLASMIFAIAQDNLQLIDTSKMWSSWRGGSNIPPEYRISTYHKFQDDTLINQTSYKKIWESQDEQHIDWELKGFIRSDTNGDIYVRDQLNYEGLIYRFNVQVGDTFTIFNPFNQGFVFQVLVTEIDSTFIIPANQFRKRIKLIGNQLWAGEEYWIEGVGSLAGIIVSGADIVQQTGWAMYDALCQWQNDTLVYSNPEYNSCFITVSTPEISNETSEIIIKPNPLINQSAVIVKSHSSKCLSLNIHDILGNLTHTYQFPQNFNIILHRSQFKRGLYILTLQKENNILKKTKLIVQ